MNSLPDDSFTNKLPRVKNLNVKCFSFNARYVVELVNGVLTVYTDNERN